MELLEKDFNSLSEYAELRKKAAAGEDIITMKVIFIDPTILMEIEAHLRLTSSPATETDFGGYFDCLWRDFTHMEPKDKKSDLQVAYESIRKLSYREF